jgi:hypothetical protein
VHVEVNGKPLKKHVVPNGRQTYDVEIPLQYLKSDAVLLIQFDFPNALSPLELRLNPDNRALSMAVFNLTLPPVGTSQK